MTHREFHLTKFQQDLITAIAEWRNAMNTEDIETVRAGAGKKLEALISRAVDCKTTDNAKFDDEQK